MLAYCLKCVENTKGISPLLSKAINGGTIVLAKCAVCNPKTRLKNKKQKGYQVI